MHSLFISLLYIGISLIACNRGILTQIFFNSFKMSYSGWTTGFSITSLSGNGGTLFSWIDSCGGWVCTGIFKMFTSYKMASFTGSFESSSSSFSSWMMTDDLVLSFTTLPDRNWISCTGIVEIRYDGRVCNSMLLRAWVGLLFGLGISCAGNNVGRGGFVFWKWWGRCVIKGTRGTNLREIFGKFVWCWG